MNTDSAISTPDDSTIVFHLKAAVRRLRLPRHDAAVGPGAGGQGHRARSRSSTSSPPARTCSRLRRRQELHAEAQPELGPGDRPEPQGAAGPDRRCTMNVDAEDIDNRLISGDLDIALAGTGVTAATQSRVLGDPTLKARADNPTLGRLWYTSINPTVKPFDNIECRKAIEYAMDKTSYQTAYGGEFAGGDAGHDPAAADHPGLQAVRPVPDAGRQGRPDQGQGAADQVRSAERLLDQHLLPHRAAEGEGDRRGVPAALAKVGIKVTPKGFPKKDYFSTYAGNPPYVAKNGSAWSSTAGARTGTTASASCPRSSTPGSSARPVVRRTPASGSPRSTSCSTRRRASSTTPSARATGPTSTRR